MSRLRSCTSESSIRRSAAAWRRRCRRCAPEQQRDVQTRALVMNRARKTTHEVVDGVPVTRVASWLTVGAVAVAPALPLLARARRGRRRRAARAQPDGAAGVLPRAADGAADRLVPQRGRAARLALPAVLPAAPRFALRRVARIVVASPPMRDVAGAGGARQTKCVVIPYGLEPERYPAHGAVSATRRRACAGARAGRSCSSSAGWWPTKDSTSCSRRWPASRRSWPSSVTGRSVARSRRRCASWASAIGSDCWAK